MASSFLNFTCLYVGGFGSYLLGLNRKTYERVGGASTPGNTPDTKELGIGWMTGFLFVTYFVGLTALIPFQKVLCMNESGFSAVKHCCQIAAIMAL